MDRDGKGLAHAVVLKLIAEDLMPLEQCEQTGVACPFGSLMAIKWMAKRAVCVLTTTDDKRYRAIPLAMFFLFVVLVSISCASYRTAGM